MVSRGSEGECGWSFGANQYTTREGGIDCSVVRAVRLHSFPRVAAMPNELQTNRLRSRVIGLVAAIPEGRVTTYGAIARRLRVSPRQVARVLGSFTAEEAAGLPWFRVVAANGVISSLKLGTVGRRQIACLREEGTEVTGRNRVSQFQTVFWRPA